MTKRAALYLRVSTCEQTTNENQRRELEEVAKRSSWEIAGIYKDAGISGAKGREKGPDFDRLCNKALLRLTNDPATQFSSSSETRSPSFSRPKISGMVQPVLNPEYANAGSCRKRSSSPTSRRARSRRVVTSKVRTFGPAISIRMQIRRPSFCSAVRACAIMCAQTFSSS